MRIPLCLTTLCLLLAIPVNVSAVNREDDLHDALKASIKALRTAQESTESTELVYRSFPIPGIRSFTYPVSWVTRPRYQKSSDPFRTSKAMNDQLTKTMLYKPEPQRDGTFSYGIPLDPYFSRIYLPIPIQTPETTELKTVQIQKPVVSDLKSPEEGRGYIQFCSYKPVKKINPKTEIATVQSLDDLKNLLINTVTVQSGQRSSNDVFVPNVFSYETADANLAGLPAIKLTMTLNTQLYNVTGDRAKYEGIYTLKDGKILCAEVLAYEPQYDAYHTVFGGVLASLKLSDGVSSSSASSASSTRAPRMTPAQLRACKRAKKC